MHLLFSFPVFLDVPFRTSDILCSMTSNICHVILYVLRCLIKENPVQYFYINTISYAVNLVNFIIITLIYYITNQRVCETISIIKMLTISKNLVWPRDFESFKGETLTHFHLLIVMFKFVMVQPWNMGVCWIVLVFVTELTVVRVL